MTTNQRPARDAPKTVWRAWARSLDRSAVGSAVAEVLAAWPPMHGVVASYLAMGDEVDLGAIHDLQRCRVLVPRIDGIIDLSLHDLDPGTLVPHRFGFLEPPPSSRPVPFDHLDVILVPGLAFDRHGNRLGRGAGMYDVLLSRIPRGVTKVGVANDAAFVDGLPVEAHDQRVDWVATESGVHRVGPELATSCVAVIDAAIDLGMAPAMVRFPEGTKTSQDAARAVGSELGAIAKSLVFLVDEAPVLVICSGDHRVDVEKLAAHFGGGSARPAPLDRVREVTGFVAGGTPAVGHREELPVVADVTLARYRWVWSAGGTPDTVYPVSLARLMAASRARWADISERG